MEDAKKWINNNYYYCNSSHGYISGSSAGTSTGSGYGMGFDYGSDYFDYVGYGDGYGHGTGSGYDTGSGKGNGSGSGYDDYTDSGSGYDDYTGSGSGYGNGIVKFNDKDVYLIDNIQTIITHIKDSFAKGYILNSDLTLTPCYVAKGNGYFAHGCTLSKARDSLTEKIFWNMDTDKTIEEFLRIFKKGEKYLGTIFFKWHNYLTGSCLMGRESFVKSKGLNLEKKYTVDEFISICENNYGSSVIKKLKKEWNEI